MKILLVTGGGRGIGAAIARLGAKHGYSVCVNYRSDETSAAQVVADIQKTGGRAVAIQSDVSKPDDVLRLFDETEKHLGKITHIANNAGITGKSSRFVDVSYETMREVIDINLMGKLLVAQEAVRRMSTKHGGTGGAIVNLSSAAALLGAPGEYVWYAASKGGVESFTYGLAREVAEEGIRVNAVVPGMINTEIHEKSTGDAARVERIRPTIPMKRIGEPQDIAEAVLFLLSDQSSYTTGSLLRVSGGR
jgi:NAD(P)-dependent dehydrogenase (short-subunit alcohol dehydrogenase family)